MHPEEKLMENAGKTTEPSSVPRAPTRRRMRRLVAAAIAVLALSGSASDAPSWSPAGVVGAEEASAARWIGSVRGKAQRSSRFVSGGSTSQGDFWFDVDRRGRVRGEAVIASEPQFDAGGLDAVISYVQSLASIPAGALPGLGGLAAAEITTAVRVRVSYPEPLAVRTVPITGTLQKGRLSLDVAGGKLAGVPFRAFLTRLNEEKPLTSGRLAVAAPFAGGARVKGGHATATHQAQSRDKGGVLEQTSSYWTAHRVGGR